MGLTREEFLNAYINRVLAPWDPHREYLLRYGHGLWFKHELVRWLQPKRIVEIGVRAGYAMWAMLLNSFDSHYIGFDTWPHLPEPTEEGTSFHEAYFNHAVAMAALVGNHRVELVQADTQAEGFKAPEADLYHVDAAHGFGACYRDLVTCCDAAAPTALICVHDWNAKPIREAVRRLVAERHLQLKVVSNEWGDALIGQSMPEDIEQFQRRNKEWWHPHSMSLAIQLTELAHEELAAEAEAAREAMLSVLTETTVDMNAETRKMPIVEKVE